MTVYLLHFSSKYHQCQHYLGVALTDLTRIQSHQSGQGAKLTRAVVRAGIELTLVRTWEGDGRRPVGDHRKVERQLKKRKNSPRLCPLCNPCQTH